MRADGIKKYLVEHYEDSVTREFSTHLLGPPGIGKSQSTLEAAAELAARMDHELVDYSDQGGQRILNSDRDDFFIFCSIPLVMHEPSDMTGIPRDDVTAKMFEMAMSMYELNNGDIDEEEFEDIATSSEWSDFVRFKPLLWAKVMSDYPGILFLDDFLDVQRMDKLSVSYKVVFERKIGYYDLNDGVMVVTASNTPEQSSLSGMFPTPLANRGVILEVNKPTVNEWANWMEETYDNWDRRTLAFLKRFRSDGYLMDLPEETEVLRNFPTPRTWTRTALELNNHEDKEVIKGLLGGEVANKFTSFLEINVDVVDLINKPRIWHEHSVNAKHMLCVELANWMAEDDNDHTLAVPVMEEMVKDSKQYMILLFLSIPDHVRAGGMLSDIFDAKPEFSDIYNQTLYNRESLGK